MGRAGRLGGLVDLTSTGTDRPTCLRRSALLGDWAYPRRRTGEGRNGRERRPGAGARPAAGAGAGRRTTLAARSGRPGRGAAVGCGRRAAGWAVVGHATGH
ncbi:hypothetical protein DLJ58_00165, partial [Micromonospora arida]